MKGKKVLVTGGAGFIGSWLCQRLIEDGHQVTCLDNLSSGNADNITGLDVSFIRHDVEESIELEVDYIFNLASRASPVDFEPHAVDILLTNALGTYHMLQLAVQNKARFLQASTSEVYGDPQKHPQDEGYRGNVNPIGVRACYDESKRFAEALSASFHRQYGLDIRIARIFNTYGERMRQDDGRVISNLVNQALVGKPLTVYGDGHQTRAFCYVSDMVDGLMRLMFTDGLAGEVINLGNPKEVTILEIAKLIKKLTRSDSEVTFCSLPEDDPVKRKPDITRARGKLDWAPKVDLEPGLSRTIEYFRQYARTGCS